MSDIKKICDALAALANALPGGEDEPYVTLGLHGCADTTLRLFESGGGTRHQGEAREDQWDYVTLTIGNVQISAFGPHRRIVRHEVDSAAVDAALAQAQEALS